MKKNKIINKICSLLFCIVALFIASSCTNTDDSINNKPVIDKVSASVDINGLPIELVPTNVGFANNVYVVQGSGFATTKKIFFNDTETAFNPTLVTDNTIFVTIDINTPYANASNKLKIVTSYGTALYDFTVAPPAPLLKSFNSINAADGEVITIYGDFFLNPTVSIGDKSATILSSTLTQIKAIVPSGSNRKYVSVTTISGTSTSKQAIGTAIYDDERASFVENWLGPWDGSGFTKNTDTKIQGESSIKVVFSGYTGFKFPMFSSPVSTSGYSALRVSFKSTKDAGKFKIVVNGNYDNGAIKSFDSSWNSFIIPFSELGYTGTTINEIVVQEFGNTGGDTLYIDDLGFVLQ